MTEFSTLGVCLGGRADKQTLRQIPWAATESMLMRNSDGGAPCENGGKCGARPDD